MINTYNNVLESIGNTPLIKLQGPSSQTNCNIYGKAEFLNPGGSIKDRAALAIIKEAEEKGTIKKSASYLTNTANDIHTKQAIREKFVFFKKSANDVTNKKRNNE